MIVKNNLIVISSLGKTDCRRSKIYREDNKIFVERIRDLRGSQRSKFIALPIVLARFASLEATHKAMTRIVEAQEQLKVHVDITDLEVDQEI